MRIIAHAHNKESGIVVLIERQFGPVFNYRKKRKVMEWGYYVMWAGLRKCKDGCVFRKTRLGGHRLFKRTTAAL